MFESYDDILTIEDLCEALRIGKSKAYRLLLDSRINGYREGKDWKIPKPAVISYVFEQAGIK